MHTEPQTSGITADLVVHDHTARKLAPPIQLTASEHRSIRIALDAGRNAEAKRIADAAGARQRAAKPCTCHGTKHATSPAAAPAPSPVRPIHDARDTERDLNEALRLRLRNAYRSTPNR